jgi:hypothetical protein
MSLLVIFTNLVFNFELDVEAQLLKLKSRTWQTSQDLTSSSHDFFLNNAIWGNVCWAVDSSTTLNNIN